MSISQRLKSAQYTHHTYILAYCELLTKEAL